ncbi:MFS transporter [Kribbella sp. C-35]|uniref:MFS transporter n=1 Tax=Kribbella sp. C-35 TaxID=2789276 RepID=UPI00397DCD14
MSTGTPIGRTLGSLRDNRAFRLFWFSNLFFFGGVWTQTLVLGWLAWETTHSDFLVAVYTAVRLAPLLLGPFAGAFADRHNRVRLLIVAASWALVTVSVVATLASLGKASYWVLVVGGLAIGLAQSPSQPARASLVMDLVGRENLSNANALNSMALNMTQVIGPAVGGLMITGLGAPAALSVSTFWYAISLVTLLPLREYGRVVGGHTGSALRMVTSGLRDLARNRLASTVLLITLAANTLLWPFGVLQTTLLLMTTDESLHGRALGVQELAIGIMPLASLALGAFAEHYGVDITTCVSAVLLVAGVAALGLWTPALLRYSGHVR